MFEIDATPPLSPHLSFYSSSILSKKRSNSIRFDSFTMPKRQETQPLTGNHTKKRVHSTQSEYRAAWSFSAHGWSTLKAIQFAWALSLGASFNAMQNSMFLLALQQLGLNMPIPMLRESVLFSFSNLALAQVYCQFDFLLADINPDKDDRAIFGPDRKRRIQDLTESEARLWIRFTKSQLTRIFNLCQFSYFTKLEIVTKVHIT